MTNNSTITRRPKARRNPRRGGVIVEAALVLPLVLLMILGVMEYGRFLMTLHVFNNAAREGCRYAVTHTQPVILGGTTYGNATSDVTGTVTKMLAGQTLASQNVQVFASDSVGNNTGAWTSVSAGQSICVQITGNYQVTVPTLLGMSSTIPVNIKVAMRVEGN